jgi:glycosyltransferase involved in cell wall biosynthesis
MLPRVFIHAVNVHQGGGRSLLEAIINAFPIGMPSVLSLDSRMPLFKEKNKNIYVKRVQPTILRRLLAEISLLNDVMLNDVVICFGNLPPLFKLRGHVVVFVQNRYLIDDVNLDGFSIKTRLRLRMERLWLCFRMSNADEFVVQTLSMNRLLDVLTQGKIPVSVLPFMSNHEGYFRSVQPLEKKKEKDFDFVYVASGEPHKNHRQLIEAWCLLAKDGVFPTLGLTLDKVHFVELCSFVEQKVRQYQLNVKNLGRLPHEHVKQIYNQADALIYPSVFESFGLPLIEARQAGLAVLASELDYVRDVLDPEEVFDPNSAISIARAVKRFMDLEEEPLSLLDAKGFLNKILEKVK